jgi:hypothetical protein
MSVFGDLELPNGPFEDVALEGLGNGYPSCCALFFTIIWMPSEMVLHPDGLIYYKAAKIARDWYRQQVQAADVEEGYVPCPACLLKILRQKREAA